MKFCVVSNGSELLDQCRRILEETVSDEWSLIQSGFSETPDADVYIWDFAFAPCIPIERPDMPIRTLFVVESSQLDRFRHALGARRASIVLKPVQLSALRPFMEHALGRRAVEQSIASDGRTHKDDGDDLLESVLHANLKLQEYDQFRTNFLARALHDFRAPLTALDGYCGLLIEQRIGSLSQDQLKLLRRMQHSVKRLTGLSNAMFELSAGRQSKRELNFREGDVEASINQAIHELAQDAQQRQIRINAVVCRPSQPFSFDAGKIEQVLINLLENACKFTPKQGSVEISAYPVAWECATRESSRILARNIASEALPLNAYRIDVRDVGPGIPVEHIHSIFEEYTTYGGSSDRSAGGLGLAICRMIIEAHHGALWAENGATGAQFSLVLPYVQHVQSVSAPRMASTSRMLHMQAAAANTQKLSA